MQELIILHNESCSKSNCLLQLLNDNQLSYTVRNYLINPLTAEEIEALLEKLQLSAVDIVRKNESLYKEAHAHNAYSNNEWITILTNNPILMERPIAIYGSKATVCRPAERIFEIL